MAGEDWEEGPSKMLKFYEEICSLPLYRVLKAQSSTCGFRMRMLWLVNKMRFLAISEVAGFKFEASIEWVCISPSQLAHFETGASTEQAPSKTLIEKLRKVTSVNHFPGVGNLVPGYYFYLFRYLCATHDTYHDYITVIWCYPRSGELRHG